MRLVLLALAALAAATTANATPAPSPAAPPPPATTAAAEALAGELGPPPEGRRALLLAVEARAPALARTVEAALEAALAARGYAVTPDRGGGDAEARARTGGHDWLLRVRAGVTRAPAALTLAGDLIPAWTSFFQQRRPDARAIPPRVVQARTPADAGTLLLGAEEWRAGGPFASLRTLGQLPGRVLALAAGDVDGAGRRGLVVVTAAVVAVLGPDATPIAIRPAAGGAAPLRDPTAVVAVGDFGSGRIAVQHAGAPAGEVLTLHGDALDATGTLEAAPLCAGSAGPLFGAFAPGTGVLVDALGTWSHVSKSGPGPAASRAPAWGRPRSARTLYGAAAAPRGGPIAFATLGTDLDLGLLDRDLAPVAAAAPAADLATGSGFALADLDADGTAELVASSPVPGATDRIRVLAPLAKAPLLFESPPVDGTILAAAGGDLTGDGVDDAVLAAVTTGADGEVSTTLLLLTADPGGAP